MTQQLFELATGELAPPWEQKLPGRLQWELQSLASAGAGVEIDGDALERRVLQLTIEWPTMAGLVRLRAVYPENFPRFRPQVYLLADPATFPKRHVSPIEGQICLLGRDTRQWPPQHSLAALLQENLEHALNGTGDEDPQGEPPEFWWNCNATPDCFFAIDSGFDLGDAKDGWAEVRVALTNSKGLHGRVVITRLLDAKKNVLSEWQGPLPWGLEKTGKLLQVPWTFLAESILPEGGDQLEACRQSGSTTATAAPKHLTQDVFGLLYLIAYPGELQHEVTGTGWLTVLHHGAPRRFKPGKKQDLAIFRSLRSGADDLVTRAPSAEPLRTAAR